jgi:methylmalonyl-CoA mutase C-terminal domain/subunit
VLELLKEKGAQDILVIGGGVIPDEDIPELKKAGIKEIFTPGTPTSSIVDFIKNNVKD